MFYRGKSTCIYLPLLFLFSTKLAQGLLIVFCPMFCIFQFLVSDKNAELNYVFFVYFVGFVICFIFVLLRLPSDEYLARIFFIALLIEFLTNFEMIENLPVFKTKNMKKKISLMRCPWCWFPIGNLWGWSNFKTKSLAIK